jgi:hypothetical protein
VEEDGTADALTVVGDRGVGMSHLERCDAHKESTEPDRGLACINWRQNAEPVGNVGDDRRFDQHGQLSKDGVV